MADQPKRDRVNDLPDEGIPASETAPAPMTHEQAAQLAEDLEQLPNRISDGVSRALSAQNTAPTVPETPRGAPQAREASFGPGTPGDDAADVYGATQRLSGALGTVLPGFGEIASIMGKFRSIADAVGNFQDVLGSIGQLTPKQLEEEYAQNLAVLEADPAHKKALAAAESAIAKSDFDRAVSNARSTTAVNLGLQEQDSPYQPDLPAAHASPPRVSAADTPENKLKILAEMFPKDMIPLTAPAVPEFVGPPSPSQYLPPEPAVIGRGPKGLLNTDQQEELLGIFGPPVPAEVIARRQSVAAEPPVPAFFPPLPPAARLPNGLLLDPVLQESLLKTAPGTAPLKIPSGKESPYDYLPPDPVKIPSAAQAETPPGMPAAAAAEAPELPVPPLPTSPVAPFLPEAPPTAAPDADNWLERMALAVSHFGDAVKDSTGAEHDMQLPASVHVGDGLTRDEGAKEATNWREEADEVRTGLAALAASHGPRGGSDGEDSYRVPGFSPLREVLPRGMGPAPSTDDEIGLGGPMRLPTGNGADMHGKDFAAMVEKLDEMSEKLSDLLSEMKDGKGKERDTDSEGSAGQKTDETARAKESESVAKEMLRSDKGGSNKGSSGAGTQADDELRNEIMSQLAKVALAAL